MRELFFVSTAVCWSFLLGFVLGFKPGGEKRLNEHWDLQSAMMRDANRKNARWRKM
jgi:hypothetical protein